MGLAPDQIAGLVAQHHDWFHRIDLPFGIVTPGTADSAIKEAALRELGLPDDLHGCRVLDVGCMDGYFSFAMERRGATVIAVDKRPFKGSKIETAIRCLDSRITYVQGNVYELRPSWLGKFDCVLFLGVLYHLRHPLLGLEAIRSVTHTGSPLYLNTLVLDEFLTLPDGRISKLRDEASTLVSTSLWQSYPGRSLAGDITNEFVPNMAAVRAALRDCRFTPIAELTRSIGGFVKAEAIDDPEIEAWTVADRSA